MDEKSTAVASYNREALEGKHGYDKSVPIVESENDLSSGGEGQVMDTLLEYGPSQYVASDHQEKVPSKSSKKASLQDVLNAILPPRVFTTSEGHKVRQQASIRKAERDDVIALQMSLDERLQERQARESGLCPVREQLYSQCYDELIRQVTVEKAERGILLQRVRDEVKMTISAYQTLYHSSITFGNRKSLEAEQGSLKLQERVAALKAKKAALQDKLKEEQSMCESAQKRVADKAASELKKREEKKEFLKYQAQHLETFLKQVRAQQASSE